MGVADGIATELPCRVDSGVATPRPQPPLPLGPSQLYSRLSAYELAALALPDEPDEEEIAEVLFRHPLIPDQATAARLGHDILARMDASR
jgi:alpha-galactosidase/6-phospho-beta-glucosidase family protein